MNRPRSLSRTPDDFGAPRAPEASGGPAPSVTDSSTARPSALAVARLIRSTNRGFGQCLQTSLARFGFSSGMWHFLRVLNEEDGITQRELSQRAGTVEPTALKQLERMERAGLIRRQRDTEDRRKIRLFLTDAGRELYARLIAPATAIPRAALDGLSEGDIARLVQHLNHIQRNLDDYYGRLIQDTASTPVAASTTDRV